MADTTLWAVAVGGLLAGSPTVIAALLAGRTEDRKAEREFWSESVRQKGPLYEELLTHLDSSSVTSSFLTTLDAFWTRRSGIGGSDEKSHTIVWLERYRALVSRVRLHGSDDVAEAVGVLDEYFWQIHRELSTMLKNREGEPDPDAEFDAALKLITNSDWESKMDDLIAVMRADVKTLAKRSDRPNLRLPFIQ